MTALGMTALHLRIAEFKITNNFIICDWLPDMELIFGIDIQKKFSFLHLGQRKEFKRKEIPNIQEKLQTKGNNWDS